MFYCPSHSVSHFMCQLWLKNAFPFWYFSMMFEHHNINFWFMNSPNEAVNIFLKLIKFDIFHSVPTYITSNGSCGVYPFLYFRQKLSISVLQPTYRVFRAKKESPWNLGAFLMNSNWPVQTYTRILNYDLWTICIFMYIHIK